MKADLRTGVVTRIATEIATDEMKHVAFLRTALGSAAVPIPELNMCAISHWQNGHHLLAKWQLSQFCGALSRYGTCLHRVCTAVGAE